MRSERDNHAVHGGRSVPLRKLHPSARNGVRNDGIIEENSPKDGAKMFRSWQELIRPYFCPTRYNQWIWRHLLGYQDFIEIGRTKLSKRNYTTLDHIKLFSSQPIYSN